jgi:hypothetical protein
MERSLTFTVGNRAKQLPSYPVQLFNCQSAVLQKYGICEVIALMLYNYIGNILEKQ